jgi:4-aminobutyrate aminotransferase/(S)-3-amino-2-methylpropionate transaminase
VQGEGGFVAMPPDYLARLHELCRSHGILWVNDEVQSGVGRTGTMWAVQQHAGVEPDMTVFGKSIGGGLPLAGVTGGAEVMDAVPPGGLGGTFGGNPLSCAAALAVLDIVTEPEFLAGARELGKTVRARLEDIASRTPDIGEVRGLGSMLAFEFVERTPDRAKSVVDAAFERGLVLLSCGLYGNVIRLLPPLNIAPEELDEGLAILEDSLAA